MPMFLELILILAFVLSNLGWIIYSDRRDKRELDERRELFNRIAHPKAIIEKPETVRAINEATADQIKQEQMSIPERYEFAAVGKIDPHLERDNDGS